MHAMITKHKSQKNSGYLSIETQIMKLMSRIIFLLCKTGAENTNISDN